VSEQSFADADSGKFDYESFWELREKHRNNFPCHDDYAEKIPVIAPQPLPRANQDTFVLDMDDDEFEAYQEFIAKASVWLDKLQLKKGTV
jgi:hypothetical protein